MKLRTLTLLALATIPAHAMAQSSLFLDSTPLPMGTESAYSGSLLSKSTELLTPGGIIDDPAPLTLTRDIEMPPLGPSTGLSSSYPAF